VDARDKRGHDEMISADAHRASTREWPPGLVRSLLQRRPPARIAAISFDSGIRIDNKPRMPKKPGTNPKGEFAFFNVVYEDDSVRSNRRVPSDLLGGLDGDEPARAFIHQQDREIAEKSGRAALEIKSISRVGAKKK
jgi:hypothetical protein